MLIGLPKEVKDNEFRVGMTPAAVKTLIQQGHQVRVQSGAGEGSFFTDSEYRSAGADIVPSADEAWAAQLVVKVKEPIPPEFPFLRNDLILFTFLHLASNRELTEALLKSGATAIAFETVQTEDGRLPLLMPMSEIAGRLSAQVGATYLQKPLGGRGILMSGIAGVAPANVAILGAGSVGANAARIASGYGARVTVLDINRDRLQYLEDIYRGQIITRISDQHTVEEEVYRADLVIGAVLIPGGKAPWLIKADMLPKMQKGSVIVDVAVDQGGCIETSRPTTHSDPTFEVDGIVHYCVANMPGAVPRTSTSALTNQTICYTRKLADDGLEAIRNDRALQLGLNTYQGVVTHRALAESLGLEFTAAEEALAR
ncbi:MAG: alanine dehydrogenase [Gammaproteobacteria bacterium]